MGQAKDSLRTKLNIKNDTHELEAFLHQVVSAPYNTSKCTPARLTPTLVTHKKGQDFRSQLKDESHLSRVSSIDNPSGAQRMPEGDSRGSPSKRKLPRAAERLKKRAKCMDSPRGEHAGLLNIKIRKNIRKFTVKDLGSNLP